MEQSPSSEADSQYLLKHTENFLFTFIYTTFLQLGVWARGLEMLTVKIQFVTT